MTLFLFMKLSAIKPLHIQKLYDSMLKNGYEKSVLRKIWNDWEKSGTYLFNKAHALCYTWIGYQMAYLKANYPNEFAEVISSKEQ